MRSREAVVVSLLLVTRLAGAQTYTNFESSHVHPIALTPSGQRLLVVNTPDAVLEVFAVDVVGNLTYESSIPVGLEPVTVKARTDNEAWVVNHLSDSVSVVDLTAQATVRTLVVGDEPTDVAFAAGRAFVTAAQEDAVKVFDLANLDAAPQVLTLPGRYIRALAVTPDQTRVFAIPMHSGNKTTVVNGNVIATNDSGLNTARLSLLGRNDITCNGNPPPYPPLPPGITRNPALTDPADGIPRVGLIVQFNDATGRWEDETGQDWNNCLPLRLSDLDLFEIDTTSLALTTRANYFSLGTTLFDVSVKPDDGRVFVTNTDARNLVRFDHPLGLEAHIIDTRLSAVGVGDGSRVIVDLNAHIDRQSNPATNLAERQASIAQPGMMVWTSDGSAAFVAAIGSRKVFRVDGSCGDGSCIFGADRTAPEAAVVGEGPTGVALLESANRLYVLSRFSNSVTVVDASTLATLTEIDLNDPSPAAVKDGRRLLYDGIDTSGHGDASCASCHVFGDTDMLSWDLGNPEGTLAPYTTPLDNVRFVRVAATGQPPIPCDPANFQIPCASKLGFDPQKGPMFTQTLRGMLEPLHWRGDKPTMREFNPAFVTLLGAQDIGPVNGVQPARLNAAEMATFREFTMGLRFPPNPFRNPDDSLPNAPVAFPKFGITGNPSVGQTLFGTLRVFGSDTCANCHASAFGTAGGQLGGVEPTEPTSLGASPVMNGLVAELTSLHFDVEPPHLRNLYTKMGPTFGTPGGTPPVSVSGFGFQHDGSAPDLFTMLSTANFVQTVQNTRDIAAFVLHFPTGTRPAVGRTVTVPPGAPPTGTGNEETSIATLMALGDVADANRHCELVVSTRSAGRQRRYHLFNGLWTTDRLAEPPIDTQTLRTGAQERLSFLCAPIGSGPRLGGDRDVDLVLDGDDNCPMHVNPGQGDVDQDGLGDACDPITLPTTTSTSVPGSSTTSTTLPQQVTFTSIAAEDGNIVESGENTDLGGIAASDGTELRVGDNQQDRQFKGILSFDTSALPDGATITAASVQVRRQLVRGTNPFTILGPCLIDVRSGGFGGSTVLAASDFEAPATAPAAGTLGNAAANGDSSVGSLDAAGLAAINRTGPTQIRLAFTLDDNDNLVQDHILYNSGETTDPTQRPRLVVTFTVGTPTTTSTSSFTTTSSSTSTSSSSSTTTTVPTTSTSTSTSSSTSSTTSSTVSTSSTSTSSSTSTTTSSSSSSTSSSSTSTTSTTSTSTSSTTIVGTPVQISLRSIATQDGSVIESSETSNAGGTTTVDNDEIHLGDQANDRQFRGIVSFDTSAIPDNAVVLSATLRLRRVGVLGTNPFQTHGTCRIDVAPAFGGNTSLQVGDFQAPATAPAAGVLGNATANGLWSEGALAASGLAAIDRTGTTQLRVAFDLDDNDNGVADRIRYNSGEAADPSLRPELVVTYQP